MGETRSADRCAGGPRARRLRPRRDSDAALGEEGQSRSDPLGLCIVPRDAAESYDQFGSFGLFESELGSRRMSTEQVALIPRCAECLDVWLPNDEDRWHCYVVVDGPDDQLVFYCPNCAEREFT